MVELNLIFNFKTRTDHFELIQVISPVFDLAAGDIVNVEILFPKTRGFVYSDHLMVVVSAVNYLRSREITVNIVIKGTSTYAGRVNFHELLQIDYEETYSRRDNGGRFIELKSFNSESIYPLQDELNMILYQRQGISRGIRELLFYCLGEIMDNTILHSGFEAGWLSAQYFPSTQEIRLIICDSGIGIHESLTKNTKYEPIDEAKAIELCVQRGVTNGKGLGFGLYATSQFILHNQGDLLIYSGGHFLQMKNGAHTVSQGPRWRGTMVFLRIKTDIPVDYKLIMPKGHTLPDDYEFFIDKFFGEDNELW